MDISAAKTRDRSPILIMQRPPHPSKWEHVTSLTPDIKFVDAINIIIRVAERWLTSLFCIRLEKKQFQLFALCPKTWRVPVNSHFIVWVLLFVDLYRTLVSMDSTSNPSDDGTVSPGIIVELVSELLPALKFVGNFWGARAGSSGSQIPPRPPRHIPGCVSPCGSLVSLRSWSPWNTDGSGTASWGSLWFLAVNIQQKKNIKLLNESEFN